MKLMLRLTALVLVLALGLFPPLSAGAADTTVTLPDSWNGQWQDGPNGEPLYLEGYGYLSTLSSISNVLTAGETGQVYCKPGAVLPALLPALSLSEDVIFYGNGATINGPLYVEFDSSITFQQLIFDTGLSAGATAQATLHLLDCAFSGSWENAAFQLTGGACFLDRCTFQLGGGMPVQLTELAGASQLKDCVFAAWPQGPAIVATLDGCPKLSVNRSRFYVDTESYAPDTELLSVTGTTSDTVIDVSRNYWSGFPPTEFSHNGHPVVYTPDFAGDPETQLIRFPFYRTEAMDTEVTYVWEEGDGPVTEIIRYPDGMIHTSIVYPSAAVDETATTTSGIVMHKYTDPDGILTGDATLPISAVDETGRIVLPLPFSCGLDRQQAPELTLTLTGGESALVEIPLTNMAPELAVLVLSEPNSQDGALCTRLVIDGDSVLFPLTGTCILRFELRPCFYHDVIEEVWYHDPVQFCYARGLMMGTGDGVFSPNLPLTRAEAAAVLARYAGVTLEPAAERPFSDVPTDQWYAAAVSWAKENGIVNGYDEDTFCPLKPVTREEFAVMLYRCATVYNGPEGAGQGHLSTFPDGDHVSPWAEDAMRWAISLDLFRGDSQGLLLPQGTTERSHAAALLQRLLLRETPSL